MKNGKEKEKNYGKRDYEHYQFSAKEILKYTGQGAALCLLADYLFYQSLWALLLMAPAVFF